MSDRRVSCSSDSRDHVRRGVRLLHARAAPRSPRRTSGTTSPRSGACSGSARTRRVASQITPSTPSEPIISSRRSGPAAVRGQRRGATSPPGATMPQPLDELVDAAVAGRGLAGGTSGNPAADRRELERLREVAQRQSLGRELPLGLRAEQPALERGRQRGVVHARAAGRGGAGPARSPPESRRPPGPPRPPRSSRRRRAPPPRARAAHSASSARTWSAEPGSTTASGAASRLPLRRRTRSG